MPHYYVEGLFANRKAVKKKLKAGAYPAGSIEPFGRTIWANNPQEAIKIATGELQGGVWTDGPKVSLVTEEQRMRSQGAPEFPGLTIQPSKPRKSK